MWPSLIAALSLSAAAGALSVPYLPQSEDLCGGAAVAMVYRYWGDAHASVQQFTPLVDAHAGGIATDRLIAAIRAQGWRATAASGSTDLVRSELDAGTPPIILLEERPHRYHYVVVVGIDADGVVVHDPAIGPSRRIRLVELERRWRATDHWMLVVEPGVEPRAAAAAAPPVAPPDGPGAPTECDRLLDDAIDEVKAGGVATADAAFGAVRERCPRSSGPLRELAGVRFAQHRWHDAASLATAAVDIDPHDTYAWNVLASSRFMQDDFGGSLDAWNRIGQPQIDLVRIEGVGRMRYQQLSRILDLTPNTVLTGDAFARAARRLADMPDQTSSRISYRPAEDGFAVVDVVVAERPVVPRQPVEWAATAARFLVDREAEVAVPGGTGQGEVWELSWRWWNNRPRVGLSFATPRAGWMPGIWRVDADWEEQTYSDPLRQSRVRERRAHAGLGVSDWLSRNLKYEITGGVDVWNGADHTVSAGAGIQRRLLDDKLALFADFDAWFGVGSAAGFRGGGARAIYNSASTDSARWLVTAAAGVEAVSDGAPLAVWPGAGDGHARPALLRAHPLLDDGVVVGPAFGRTLAHASIEEQRWLDRGALARFGLAAFVDAARPWRGMDGAGARVLLDAGVGLRIRVPGTTGVLRADFAHGIVDGARAVSVAWQR